MASSIAWLAPCARNGSIGCAASPMSVIRRVLQVSIVSRSCSAQRLTESAAPISSRTSEFQPEYAAASEATSPAADHDSVRQPSDGVVAPKLICLPREIG